MALILLAFQLLFSRTFLFAKRPLRLICAGLLLGICDGTSPSSWAMSDEYVSDDILKSKD